MVVGVDDFAYTKMARPSFALHAAECRDLQAIANERFHFARMRRRDLGERIGLAHHVDSRNEPNKVLGLASKRILDQQIIGRSRLVSIDWCQVQIIFDGLCAQQGVSESTQTWTVWPG